MTPGLTLCTLGARDFSCAVSGFGQVLKTCQPAANTQRKLLVACEKKPLVPRVNTVLSYSFIPPNFTFLPGITNNLLVCRHEQV